MVQRESKSKMAINHLGDDHPFDHDLHRVADTLIQALIQKSMNVAVGASQYTPVTHQWKAPDPNEIAAMRVISVEEDVLEIPHLANRETVPEEETAANQIPWHSNRTKMTLIILPSLLILSIITTVRLHLMPKIQRSREPDLPR
jgi:hypothetical protein